MSSGKFEVSSGKFEVSSGKFRYSQVSSESSVIGRLSACIDVLLLATNRCLELLIRLQVTLLLIDLD